MGNILNYRFENLENTTVCDLDIDLLTLKINVSIHLQRKVGGEGHTLRSALPVLSRLRACDMTYKRVQKLLRQALYAAPHCNISF